MSWAALASNQCISFNDLQDAVSTGIVSTTGTSIPTSNELIVKSQAATYVNLDTSNSGYAGSASNEVLTKSCIGAVQVYLNVAINDATSTGDASNGWSYSDIGAHANAANMLYSGTSVVHHSGGLVVGTVLLYTMYPPFNTTDYYYLPDTNQMVQFSSVGAGTATIGSLDSLAAGNVMLVTIDAGDLYSSNDNLVHFFYYGSDGSGPNAYSLGPGATASNYNTGICIAGSYGYGAYIITGDSFSGPTTTPVSNSYISLGTSC